MNNDNEKKSPDQNISQFILVMSGIVEKIKNNRADISDYKNLEEMMKILGAPPEIMKGYLIKNNFHSWEDFYNEKNKKESDQNIMAVKSVEGAISGFSSAATEILNKILRGGGVHREKEPA